MSARLTDWRPGAYLRSSGALLFWLLGRAALQALMVVLLARGLGAVSYGQFVAALAVAGLSTPLAVLGLHAVILRDGAREPEQLPTILKTSFHLWGPGLLTASLFAFALVGLSWLGGHREVSLSAALTFIVAEIAAASVVEIISRGEQSRHRIGLFGAIQAGLPAFRLLALGVLMAAGGLSIQNWMWTYAMASLGYALALLAHLCRELPTSKPGNRRQQMLADGRPFLLGALSTRVQSEFNKPVLAQASLAATGNFSVAQRVVDIATLPLIAMQEALWPRLFSKRTNNRRTTLLGAGLILVGLGMGLMQTLLAPLLPLLLGPDFTEASELLVFLAWLPVVQAARNLGHSYLIMQKRSSFLSLSYLVGAISSILLTAVLVAQHGVIGCAAAAYLAELAVLVLLGLDLLKRRLTSGEPAASPEPSKGS